MRGVQDRRSAYGSWSLRRFPFHVGGPFAPRNEVSTGRARPPRERVKKRVLCAGKSRGLDRRGNDQLRLTHVFWLCRALRISLLAIRRGSPTWFPFPLFFFSFFFFSFRVISGGLGPENAGDKDGKRDDLGLHIDRFRCLSFGVFVFFIFYFALLPFLAEVQHPGEFATSVFWEQVGSFVSPPCFDIVPLLQRAAPGKESLTALIGWDAGLDPSR